jgi:diketogulonate reductase-like aldo/keto reductase
MYKVESNGAEIPAIGLGTWDIRGAQCVEIVAEGLRLGYRHIDTAQGYDNEREVGEGLRASGVARDDVFLTTKVWHDKLNAGALETSVEESIARLGVDHVDLLLVHWPNPDVPVKETMEAMGRVRRNGLTRNIGISNFPVALIEEAVAVSPVPIVTNQIEYHPYLDQTKIIDACRRHGISITAYCPIARAKVIGDPVMEDIAARHSRNPVQVALRWLVQQPGVVAIPRTSSKTRLAENLDIDGFNLTDAEMAAIADLAHPEGRIVNVAWAPKWD